MLINQMSRNARTDRQSTLLDPVTDCFQVDGKDAFSDVAEC